MTVCAWVFLWIKNRTLQAWDKCLRVAQQSYSLALMFYSFIRRNTEHRPPPFITFLGAQKYLTRWRKKWLIWAGPAHHGMEDTGIGAWGNWSCCVHSQGAEKWGLSLFTQSGISAYGRALSTRRAGLPASVKPVGDFLTGRWPRTGLRQAQLAIMGEMPSTLQRAFGKPTKRSWVYTGTSCLKLLKKWVFMF